MEKKEGKVIIHLRKSNPFIDFLEELLSMEVMKVDRLDIKHLRALIECKLDELRR